jgi:excisionase family DNA binding protein
MAAEMLVDSARKFVDYAGALELTRLSKTTLQRLAREGKVTLHKVGRRTLFSIENLNRMLAAAAR